MNREVWVFSEDRASWRKDKRDGGRTDTSEKLEKDGFGRLKGRARRRLRYSEEVVQPNTIKN